MIEWLKQQFELWIERREMRRLCNSCETLKEQLFNANTEKAKLLEQLIELTNPKPVIEEVRQDFKPVMPKLVPWHIRKSILEAEARAEAKIKREQAAEANNKDLEAELLKLADEKLPEANNG